MHSHSSLSSLLSRRIRQTNTMLTLLTNTEDLSVKFSTSNLQHRHPYHSNSRAILTPLTLTLKKKLQALKNSPMFLERISTAHSPQIKQCKVSLLLTMLSIPTWRRWDWVLSVPTWTTCILVLVLLKVWLMCFHQTACLLFVKITSLCPTTRTTSFQTTPLILMFWIPWDPLRPCLMSATAYCSTATIPCGQQLIPLPTQLYSVDKPSWWIYFMVSDSCTQTSVMLSSSLPHTQTTGEDLVTMAATLLCVFSIESH